jgi:predicted PhzF superfamily epimerase YddE/YHI9
VAAQGTAMGRAGRVYVQALEGRVWVGGHVTPCVEGQVTL